MNRRSSSFSSTARWWACCRSLTPSSSESISLTRARPCGSAPTCGASSIYGESAGSTAVICSHSNTFHFIFPATWTLPSGTTLTSAFLRSSGCRPKGGAADLQARSSLQQTSLNERASVISVGGREAEIPSDLHGGWLNYCICRVRINRVCKDH